MGHPPHDDRNDMQESLDKVLGLEDGEFPGDQAPLEEDWELEDFEEVEAHQNAIAEQEGMETEESYYAPRRRAGDFQATPPSGAGGAAFFGGFILLALGVAFAALSLIGKGGALTQALQPLGLEPSMLFLSGIVLILIGNGQSKAGRNLLASIGESLHQGNQEMERLLSELREAQQQSPQAAAPAGDVQISLTKLENMIVSLTKATRMYNKPLVDLVGMMTDQGKELEEIRSDLEGLEKAMAENAVTSEKKFEGLVQRLRGDTQELEEIFEKSREALLAELKPFVGQKADQAGEKLQLKLKEDRRLLKETFENLGTSLESRIKEAFSKPQAKEQDNEALHRLESSLNDLLLAVQKIEREGIKVPAGVDAPAPAGAAAGPAPSGKAVTTEPSLGPSASAPSTVGGEAGDPRSPGRTRTVMSAIEKLKALRGDS